jgi:hypothetical protein
VVGRDESKGKHVRFWDKENNIAYIRCYATADLRMRVHEKTKDIIANQWDDTPLRIEFKLVDDVRTLLPKLPHWLAYFYGGWVTVEKEHDYDKEGKINDQSKILLVKDSSPKRWGLPSPTYTVKSIE